MRILLATDGSASADTARTLVGAIKWPAGSTIRLVTVVDPARVLLAGPWAPTAVANVDRLQADLVAAGDEILDHAARGMTHAGATLEREVLQGRPASSIVEDAARFGADVIVVGSRGHGAISSMLLGSVSAEIVDHAPSPVLVARISQLTRVVLAHDGSSFARVAEDLLTTWPIFGQVAVEVVSVAHLMSPWASGLAPTVFAEAVGDYAETAAALLRDHTDIAESAARRLRAAGLRASALASQGGPAEAIMRVAEADQADLIVLGTHGRTGLRRVLLGSVARNVMLHAPTSVLIVRGDAPEPGSAGEG